MPGEIPAAVHSLWLLPQADDAAALDALIAELAPLFATAAFRAHATVQGDLATPLAELRRVAATLAAACAPLDWPLAGLAASPHYFRSLYIGLEAKAEFSALQAQAAAHCGTTIGLAPFPHVSLAYGEPAGAGDKAALLRRYAAPPGVGPRLRFDRLVIARSSKALPIDDWCLLESFPLGRPAMNSKRSIYLLDRRSGAGYRSARPGDQEFRRDDQEAGRLDGNRDRIEHDHQGKRAPEFLQRVR